MRQLLKTSGLTEQLKIFRNHVDPTVAEFVASVVAFHPFPFFFLSICRTVATEHNVCLFVCLFSD